MRLQAVRILGAKNTRTSFLARITAPYLNSSAPSQGESITETLRNVLQKTRDLTDQLERYDIFSEVEAGLESSPGVLADDQDVDLIIKVKEASRYYLKTATDVGDGEGSAV